VKSRLKTLHFLGVLTLSRLCATREPRHSTSEQFFQTVARRAGRTDLFSNNLGRECVGALRENFVTAARMRGTSIPAMARNPGSDFEPTSTTTPAPATLISCAFVRWSANIGTKTIGRPAASAP